VSRGKMYFELVQYKSTSIIPAYSLTSNNLKKYLDSHIDIYDRHIDSITNIVHTALKVTSDCLNINNDVSTLDPNELIRNQEADCGGYASFFTTVCNELLERKKMNARYNVIHLTGDMYIGNSRVGDGIQNPYNHNRKYHTHHFNAIEDTYTHEKIYVDPMIFQRLGISYVSCGSVYTGLANKY
jgi:hypothetical protein